MIRTGKAEAILYELTPERKEKLVEVCNRIIDLLHKGTKGPHEAMITLYFVKEAIEEHYGFHMTGTAFGPNEEKH
jgi:hypothetical protein